MNNKAVRLLTILFVLLTLLVIFPSVASAAVEWPVPAYGQRYAFRIPSDINPYSTAANPVWITTTDNSGIPVDCGVACLSMLEAYATGDYSENDYVYYRMFAALNPYAAWTTTQSDMHVSADPTALGGSAYALYSSFSPQDMLNQLNAGSPLMVYRNVNGNNIHWVVVYGYDGPTSYADWGSFKIMNPYYGSNGGGVRYQHLRDFITDFGQLTRLMFRTNGVLPSRSADFGGTMTAKLCMGDGSVAVAATANGNIVLEAAADTANQEWRFTQHSNSTYVLTNLRYGTVMDLANAGTTNGTNIALCAPWDDFNPTQVYQRWYLYGAGYGYYRLSPEASYNRSLTAENFSTAAGTNLLLYDSSMTSAQQIVLTKLSDAYLTGIACSQSELALDAGASQQLTVSYSHSSASGQSLPESRRGIRWRSSDETVATVDSNGVVRAIGRGTCTITATSTYNDSFASACVVTVQNGLEIPEITDLKVSGGSIHLSWTESPLTDAGDVREYEVFVYPKGNVDDYVWSNWNVTGTSCDITLSDPGEYDVYVRAVNRTDDTRSAFSSRSFMVVGDEWLYLDELPDDLQDMEIQYLNHYNDREQAESPGEGWTRGEQRINYVNGNVRYSETPEPLQESDTLQYLGTFYYHYCDGSAAVEHYWTDRFCNSTRIDNYGQFDIAWQGADDADPRYTVYRLKWNSGEWAGGLATCSFGSADAMALYYLGYRYQEREAVITYVWTRETAWGDEMDPNADSVSYRIRRASSANRIVLPSGTTRIEAEAFMNNTTIQEVVVPSGCAYIGSKAFAGCSELMRIYLPDSAVVESDAFEGCSQVQIIRNDE